MLAFQEINFEHARTPNFRRKKKKTKENTKSHLISISPSQFEAGSSAKGLYLSENKNKNKREYFTLKLVDESFPAYTSYTDLLPPLYYIADKNEQETLIANTNPRKVFETFWLSHIQSPEKARLAIKKYYQHVHLANEFFTTYKDGWKTDQGMVYILFGTPDKVYRKKRKEIWIYENEDEKTKIQFTFVRKYGLFNSSEYKLKRPKRYAGDWYRAKDLWRKGIKKE